MWSDHIRRPEPRLIALLDRNDVDVNSFVIGEVAGGHLRPRDELTALLTERPSLPTVDHDQAMLFLMRHRPRAKGLGWIDIHLLASTVLADLPLWTHDRRMAAGARAFDIPVYGET